MNISFSDDQIPDDSSLAGILRDDGFKFYQVGPAIFVTQWRHLVMSGQVIVPLELKQYDGQSGRMLYSCITHFVTAGKVAALVERAQAESPVSGGMWVGMEETDKASARLGFGLIANESLSASELRATILKVAEEAQRVSMQLWESSPSRPAAGGSVSIAL